MGKSFLRTVLVQNRAEAADRTFQEDLPVNPLAMILVTVRAQAAGAAADPDPSAYFSMVPDLGVTFRGQDVVRGSLFDLAVLNGCVAHRVPYGAMVTGADNSFFQYTVPICFGRRPFSGMEAFPSTRRGDLVLQATVDVAVSAFDTLLLQIESVELLGAKPEAFLKYTTSNTTFASTGQESVRLPIGNPLLGALLFGTTFPGLAARTATWEQLRVKIDNVEAGYARANWDSLHGELRSRVGNFTNFFDPHRHWVVVDDTVDVETGTPDREGDDIEGYGYLDFDPNEDGEYMIDTAGRADVVIQRDSGTADAGRVLPVELVRVQSQSPV